MIEDDSRFELTLDPPGRIVVIGAGPLGIEAALYGRYLGYEMTVFERGQIGNLLLALEDGPLPMLPDRCLSPLAVSALKAQHSGQISPETWIYPTTIRKWVSEGLVPLATTDLLLGLVATHCEVTELRLAEQQTAELESSSVEDDDSFIDGDVPPDFILTVRDQDGSRTVNAEAVIVATGSEDNNHIRGITELTGQPYLFQVGQAKTGTDEQRLHAGWREIVSIFAGLGGRRLLDLYRPLRL